MCEKKKERERMCTKRQRQGGREGERGKEGKGGRERETEREIVQKKGNTYVMINSKRLHV